MQGRLMWGMLMVLQDVVRGVLLTTVLTVEVAGALMEMEGAAGFGAGLEATPATVTGLVSLWTRGSRDPTTGVELCNSSWMGGSSGFCCRRIC